MDRRNQHRMSESRPFTSISCGLPPGMSADKATQIMRHMYGSTAYFDPKTQMGVATSKAGKEALHKFAKAVDLDKQ